jgi:hypothetical protein
MFPIMNESVNDDDDDVDSRSIGRQTLIRNREVKKVTTFFWMEEQFFYFWKVTKTSLQIFFIKNSIENFFMLDHLSIVEQLNYASERIENKKTL